MSDLQSLYMAHQGRPIFCLGVAPHLDDLDLTRLRGEVTIGCNQLALRAAELDLNYVTFVNAERLAAVRDQLDETTGTRFIASAEVLQRQAGWRPSAALRKRLHTVSIRQADPEGSDYFSYDLSQFAYGGDVMSLSVQLAVWMGGNPIYIVGVDAAYGEDRQAFYAGSPKLSVNREASEKYFFPEQREWLRRVHNLLAARGTTLLNAAGECSLLNTLPRVRFRAATGAPTIAVTSKTFCNDTHLVERLKRYFPEVKLNPCDGKLAGDELVEFLADADAMILGTEPFSADVIERLPLMRYVSKYGVGLDNVDFAAARRHNMAVAYRKGVNSDSVAELTISLCLNLLRRIDESVQGYREGKWKKLPGIELAEITLGIVGYGHVGRVVARKFAALGVGRLLVNDLLDVKPEQPAELVPFEYLVAESDVISMHVSMEPQNRHLVNAELLARMKPGSFLLNTSRGEVIDEAALAAALRSGQLGGAAIDVYEREPTPNPDLVDCPHLLTTCHIAGSSNRAIKTMGWAAIENLLDFFHMDPLSSLTSNRGHQHDSSPPARP